MNTGFYAPPVPQGKHALDELSADYSNRDPDPGESAGDIAIDDKIYGNTAEERDAGEDVYCCQHDVRSTCRTGGQDR